MADNIDLLNTQESSSTGDYERSGHAAYGNSKLALNMWSYRLAEKLKSIGSSVTVNCVDPGTVSTKLLYAGWGDVSYVALPAEEAHDVFWAATHPSLDSVSGSYFVNKKPSKSPSVSYDPEMQKKVWDLLVAQTGAKYNFDEKEEEKVEKSSSGRDKVKTAPSQAPSVEEKVKASPSKIDSSFKLQESVC